MPRRNASPEEVFWEKVDKSGDCWTWTAYLKPDGYGFVKFGGRCQQAHRVAYELLVGPIPDGLEIDHRCRNRACVNPAHLEPVTHLVNVIRTPRKVVTHCKHGHPFDEANTYRHGSKRQCKTCQRRAYDAWVAKGGLAAWKAKRGAA